METIPSVKSVSLGIWVNTGSRNEAKKESGISHLIEHMFFKGTQKRSAQEIAIEMDSLGGELNAFTSKEATTYYIKVLDEHLPKGIELLSDLFLNSVFEEKDIEREKQVILEEIKMVEDTPDDYVHDLHNQRIWDSHPLGRPILGNRVVVKNIRREDILAYLDRHYSPDKIVIAVAGNFKPSQLVRLLNRLLGRLSREATENHSEPPTVKGGINIRHRKLEQVHLCLGMKGLSQSDKDRYAIYALNTMLGSSMSSRLFQEIREKRGLAYSVYSYISSFKDCGLFTVYAATSPTMAEKVVRLIVKEFSNIKKKKVSTSELKKALEHMKGNLMLSMESTTTRMSRLAKDEIYFKRYFSLKEIIREIEAVTPSQIQRLANELFDRRYITFTALGPITEKDISEDLLRC